MFTPSMYTQARLSVLPGLHWQSWDFQGVLNLWNPCVRVSQNTSVTLVVPRLSWDYQPPWHPLCQSIQAHCSYTGSAGIIPGLPTPWYPCMIVSQSTASLPDNPVSEYPRMPKLHCQSQDYPGTSKHPGTPVSEYPRTPELHRQLLN